MIPAVDSSFGMIPAVDSSFGMIPAVDSSFGMIPAVDSSFLVVFYWPFSVVILLLALLSSLYTSIASQ
jgi:hypothetical protein